VSTVSCLATGEAEQTFQGPVIVMVCKFLLKMICNDFLVAKVNCPSHVFNIRKSI